MTETVISRKKDVSQLVNYKLNMIRERILHSKTNSYTSKEELLSLTDQLAQSKLGIQLILNGDIDGFWTDVIVTYPFNHSLDVVFSAIERHLIEDCPIGIAIRERFQIYKRILQELLDNRIAITSVFCGFMRDVLSLDYSYVDDISLTGIDSDQSCLSQAQNIAKNYQLDQCCNFIRQDTLNLNLFKKSDIIVCGDFNIYKYPPQQVKSLFDKFYQHLNYNGTLLISYFSAPAASANQSSNLSSSKFDNNYLVYQEKLFKDVLQLNWPIYVSENEITEQLTQSGFNNLKIIYDSLNICYTIIAKIF